MPSTPSPLPFLPMTRAEIRALGWEQPDIVFVTGDAYIDHPAFAMAILGRTLEAEGFKVAILSQPRWDTKEDFESLGRPRLFFAVSAGNMDSMINHYTANRKPRSSDAYSPGGVMGRRPDRATNVYAQRCREAFRDVPVVVGGVEASLRRLAHYDYWSDVVKPSILATCKADLLVYGMGEAPIREIARRLDRGERIQDLRDMRGVAYFLGSREELPAFPESLRESGTPVDSTRELPSFEAVKAPTEEGRHLYAVHTRQFYHETNPFNARRLIQAHGDRRVVQNPPWLPLDEAEMDRLYSFPYARAPHSSYREDIPAMTMIATSVTIMRGCFGGCTFCSITNHQGRIIQSRSKESVLAEIRNLEGHADYKGIVSDIGGPTANMYRMRCSKPEVEAVCRRQSCVHPTICKLLDTSHDPLLELMREARQQPGVRKVHVASGIRMDLARLDPEYTSELAAHHVSGLLKVAPEAASPRVLEAMKKPPIEDFREFGETFQAASKAAGKEQYIVPYFIASHPGSGLEDMIELAEFLRQNGYRPRQVQDFIPAPMDMAAAMYYSGVDPMTMKPVEVARRAIDRKYQRALMQFFQPENYHLVREALEKAGRTDLIGEHKGALIPSRPPKEAGRKPGSRAPVEEGRMVHEIAPTRRPGKRHRS